MIDEASSPTWSAISGGGAGITLRLLDLVVTVGSDASDVVDLLATLYRPTITRERGAHEMWMGRTVVGGREGWFASVDGSIVVRTPARAIAFTNLAFELNQRAIAATTGVRMHAGAVAFGERAVVLPGVMGAGKSTLTAGLVARGAGYLTDEVAAFEPDAVRVRPYAKPISLARPPAPLADRWHPAPEVAGYLAASGLLPAEVLGAVCDRPVAVAAIVLPHYEPDAPLSLERLAPADAVLAVAGHTFALSVPGTLGRVAELAETVPVYAMRSGVLAEACATVEELVGGS
ncbi:MAG: hypothetical protein ACXVJF_08395 [Acidimicrobiia bacterium]